MTKAVYKGYKYRIYPTKEQINLIDETFDACRYVYNRALEFCIDEYKNKGVSYSYYELSSMLTEWKNTDAMWLYQYEHRALQCSIKNLVSAYKHLFKDDAGFPKFKSRFYRQSYTTNTLHGLHVYFSRSRIKLPKIKGEIKAVLHRQFTGDIKSVTVSRTNSGKYYASFCVLEKHEVMSRGDDKLGIDVGIKNYAVMSDETRIENPEWQKKYEKKLAKLQRQLSRKQKGSGRYEKQR